MEKIKEILKDVDSSNAGNGEIEVYGVYDSEKNFIHIHMSVLSFFDVIIKIDDYGEDEDHNIEKWFYRCNDKFKNTDEFIKSSIELFDEYVSQYLDGYEIIKAESNLFELDPRIEPALEELRNKEVILIK